jgi:hypothetical protein
MTGCGASGPEIATVEGTVKLDGSPLANASVVFIPAAGGRPAGARTDAAGHYQLNFSGGRKGAIPGKNKVRISTLRDPAIGDDGQLTPGSPETIPSQYNAQTTLEFDVKADEANVADFDITSEGKLPPTRLDDQDE